MRNYVFHEVTSDRSHPRRCFSSSNSVEYVLYSSYAHDLRSAYVDKYYRLPSSRWYRKHFRFSTKKEII